MENWVSLQLEYASQLFDNGDLLPAQQRLDQIESLIAEKSPFLDSSQRAYYGSLIKSTSTFSDPSLSSATSHSDPIDVKELETIINSDYPFELKNLLLIIENKINSISRDRLSGNFAVQATDFQTLFKLINHLLQTHPNSNSLARLKQSLANEKTIRLERSIREDPTNNEIRIALLESYLELEDLTFETSGAKIEILDRGESILTDNLREFENGRIVISKILMRKADLYRQIFLVDDEGRELDKIVQMFEMYPLGTNREYWNHVSHAWRRRINQSRHADNNKQTLELISRCEEHTSSLFDTARSENEISRFPFRLWLTVQQKIVVDSCRTRNWDEAFVASERLDGIRL